LLEPIPSLAEPLRPQPRPVMMSQYYPTTNVSSMLNWNNSYTPSSAIHRFMMQQPQYQYFPPYFGSRSQHVEPSSPYPFYAPSSSVPLRNFNFPSNDERAFLNPSPTVSSEDSVSSSTEEEEINGSSHFSDLVWNNLESELFPLNQFLEEATSFL